MWKWIKSWWSDGNSFSDDRRRKNIEEGLTAWYRTMVEQRPTVQCPKLNQVLEIIGSAVVTEYLQPGGPSTNKTMELSVDCSDDEVLRTVLEIKGGELGIIIRLKAPIPPDVVDGQHAQRMAQLRAEYGIAAQ